MKKLIRDGKVAILYSPGFGAGWSTWNNDPIAKQIIFYPTLVELVEKKILIKQWMLKLLFQTTKYVCVLGAGDLEIEWLPEGTKFRIHEYDGDESIWLIEDLELTA